MLDTFELIVRILGGVGILILCVVVMVSVLRFRSKEQGLTVGASPRKLYNPVFLAVASLFSIALMVLIWRPIYAPLSNTLRWIFLISGGILYFLGLAFVIWGRIALGQHHNVSSSIGVQLFEGHKLITGGPFAIVRNPMYSGFLVLIIGALLLYRTWTVVLIALCWPVFLKRARVEEQALEQAFGEEYRQYKRRVPSIFQRLWKANATQQNNREAV
jgi:protein-S-isoprenylcysteine O-methyltransferase Ste14